MVRHPNPQPIYVQIIPTLDLMQSSPVAVSIV